MRCKACDKLLSDKEASRKCPHTKQHIDLCSQCGKVSWLTESFEEYTPITETEAGDSLYEILNMYPVTPARKVEY